MGEKLSEAEGIALTSQTARLNENKWERFSAALGGLPARDTMRAYSISDRERDRILAIAEKCAALERLNTSLDGELAAKVMQIAELEREQDGLRYALTTTSDRNDALAELLETTERELDKAILAVELLGNNRTAADAALVERINEQLNAPARERQQRSVAYFTACDLLRDLRSRLEKP